MLEITIEKVSENGVREFAGAARVQQINGDQPRSTRDFWYYLFNEKAEVIHKGLLMDTENRTPHEVIQGCLTAWKEGWYITPDIDGKGGVKC